MAAAQLVEYLTRRPYPAPGGIVCALPDRFEHISARGGIKQPLVGFSVLDHRFSLAVDRQHHRPFALFELPHEFAGFPSECSQGLNVLCDVEHDEASDAQHLIRCYQWRGAV